MNSISSGSIRSIFPDLYRGNCIDQYYRELIVGGPNLNPIQHNFYINSSHAVRSPENGKPLILYSHRFVIKNVAECEYGYHNSELPNFQILYIYRSSSRRDAL